MIFKRAKDFIFSLLAPPDPLIEAIEHMTAAEFIKDARRTPAMPRIDGIESLLPYRAPIVKAALVEAKTYRNKKVTALLGAVLAELLLSDLPMSELDVSATETRIIVPIPISDKRRRDRGWNQCEIILADFEKAIAAKRLGTKFEIRSDILIKARETTDQVGMSKSDRAKNVRGSFAVRAPTDVTGRKVIIFDDIVTTGATLREARATLLAAGAARCVPLALAH
ncbi:MAG: ComF family protein [Patescibacteria group bacterium]|nr:ComF family protein [Patescibacteria group bacterium]MDE2116384.1 ComF family protein [Patescibacteria group bacterium]